MTFAELKDFLGKMSEAQLNDLVLIREDEGVWELTLALRADGLPFFVHDWDEGNG